MKFGTWVKPCRVARSAPTISMLRSFALRMSPMCRLSEYSTIGVYYTGRENGYPLLVPVFACEFSECARCKTVCKKVGSSYDQARLVQTVPNALPLTQARAIPLQSISLPYRGCAAEPGGTYHRSENCSPIPFVAALTL